MPSTAATTTAATYVGSSQQTLLSFLSPGCFMSRARIRSSSRSSHRKQRDLFLPARCEQRKRDGFLHRDGGGTVIADAPEVLHQAIEFFERWPASPLGGLPDQSQFSNDDESVIELLPRQRITPGRSRHSEDVG